MRFSVILLVILVGPVLAHAATLKVPSQHSTIQGAIDAASNGDTVLVAPGTYVENINFKGKAITVTSEQGPQFTIIDGGNTESVVTINSGEGRNSILSGFSLQNGYGSSSPQPYGGGIHCGGSSPTITGNYIQNNLASSRGGGILINGGNPLIDGNEISNNIAYARGGGIACFSGASADIFNNVIVKNDTIEGGGLFCASPANIINNTICNNSALDDGGGIYCLQTFFTVKNTIIWGNGAVNGEQLYENQGQISTLYCNIQGGWPGAYNIELHPSFSSGFHIPWHSPCINRGTNNGATSTDLDGDPRPYMGTVDIGADEFTDVHSLEADLFIIPESVGGVVHFSLHGSIWNQNRTYILLVTTAGTNPGITLPGGNVNLPLNWSYFTNNVYFIGKLDSNGNSMLTLDTLGPIPGIAGIVFSFAYALAPPSSWDFASNPINVEVVL